MRIPTAADRQAAVQKLYRESMRGELVEALDSIERAHRNESTAGHVGMEDDDFAKVRQLVATAYDAVGEARMIVEEASMPTEARR